MDKELLLQLNAWAARWVWFDKLAAFIGGDWYLYLFGLTVVLLWFNKKLRTRVYLALGSVIVVRFAITEVLKRLINEPRPYEVLPVHKLIVDNEHGLSFPSGHATIYFGLAFAFWGTEYFWPFFVAAVIGSLGRVLVGVHYPSDVLAGAVIGALGTLVLRRLFKKWILS
jgi:undecaprenyl-diphosphatase